MNNVFNFLSAGVKSLTFFENAWEQVKDFTISAGGKLLGALLVLVIGLKLADWVVKLIVKGKAFSKIDKSAQTFLKSLMNIILKAIVLISVASILGVPTTSMITILGSAGIAVGLALQGSLSNLAGGIMILIFKPFTVGDFITSADMSGTGKSISIFYTKIITPDNKRVVIPNAAVSNQPIINFSCYPTRRVDMNIDVKYGTDIQRVKEILLEIANEHPSVLKDEGITASVNDYKESSVQFVFRVWCKNEDYWDLSFDLKEKVIAAFNQNDIVIPYPQLDVHINNK